MMSYEEKLLKKEYEKKCPLLGVNFEDVLQAAISVNLSLDNAIDGLIDCYLNTNLVSIDVESFKYFDLPIIEDVRSVRWQAFIDALPTK
ncbi:MAG: hypothetical protein GY869_03785 [Planctomycetes bacterium]|nr:hypothetical protein [Planctomycetota bacterium]